MSEFSINIERVVREVLAEMGVGKAESGEPKADGDDGQALQAASRVPAPRPSLLAPRPSRLRLRLFPAS